MTMDPRADPTAPQSPAAPRRTENRAGDPADTLNASDEPRALAAEEQTEGPREGARPQADFSAPISLAGGDGEPTLTGGQVPPLFADVDETAEPQFAPPRVEPSLTRRIHQGMPSYSEPEPQIAGVVGRAARGSGQDTDREDPESRALHEGGTP